MFVLPVSVSAQTNRMLGNSVRPRARRQSLRSRMSDARTRGRNWLFAVNVDVTYEIGGPTETNPPACHKMPHSKFAETVSWNNSTIGLSMLLVLQVLNAKSGVVFLTTLRFTL